MKANVEIALLTVPVLIFPIRFSHVSSQPISSTWYDYWGADYGTYGYNPYIGGVGIPVAKPPVAAEKPGSQSLSVSVSQGERLLKMEYFSRQPLPSSVHFSVFPSKL